MGTSDGAILGVTKILDNGPASERWNIVILSDGYRDTEMSQFSADAQQFANTLLAAAPFDQLKRAINIYRVDVTSIDSGADDPTSCGGTGARARTYFDASFCKSGLRRLLTAKDSRVINVANDRVPEWHVALLVVNSPIFGGSGGPVATFSKAPRAFEVALHELGHTAFKLADEYEYYRGCGQENNADRHSGGEPRERNITTNSNRATTKWRNLILPATPVPTTRNANCRLCDPQSSPVPPGTVGLFEGAHYKHCGCYRPEFTCRMRSSNEQFCAVCRQAIVEKLSTFLPPPP